MESPSEGDSHTTVDRVGEASGLEWLTGSRRMIAFYWKGNLKRVLKLSVKLIKDIYRLDQQCEGEEYYFIIDTRSSKNEFNVYQMTLTLKY